MTKKKQSTETTLNEHELPAVEESAAAAQTETISDELNAELLRLQQELAESQAKANEYLDGWQRSRADFMNYKKRVDREQAEVYQRATGTIIKKYLEVVDDLELALRNRPEAGDGSVWANGIELIYRKLLTILENEGVQRIIPQGQLFDPNYHEAISLEPSDQTESGYIIGVVKSGYMLGDKVIRPALVRVAQ